MPEAENGNAVRVEREAISLFDDLLDVPETGRARWIDERTADPAVKARLAELLEANRLLAKASALLEPADGRLPTDAAGVEALATLWLEKAQVDLYNNMQAARGRQLAERAEALTRPLALSSAELARLHATAIQTQDDSYGWDDAYAKSLVQLHRANRFVGSLPPKLALSPEILGLRGALRSMTAALRTRGGDFFNLGDIPNACRMWRGAVINYARLDRAGALPERDRRNGGPELTRLVEDVCVNGRRPAV